MERFARLASTLIPMVEASFRGILASYSMEFSYMDSKVAFWSSRPSH